MKARGPFGWPRGGLFKVGTQADVDAGADGNALVAATTLAAWAGRGISPPQGRLTLTPAVPVLTADVAGATSLIYTPSTAGMLCPVWDGSKFVMVPFSEVSQLTTDATKSPAAVANDSNYDAFGWLDGSTFRVTRGPLWTSGTARGSGAGTTELDFTKGIPRNKNAITNGPGIGLGTFLGTIRSNGSAQIDWKMGTAAAGGGEARLCVWNCFNRAMVSAMAQDTNASWGYATAAYRAVDNSATNRVSAVMGLNEDAVIAHYQTYTTVAGGNSQISIGLDSTTAKAARANDGFANVSGSNFAARFNGLLGLGFHYLSALEKGDGVNANVYFGLTGGAQIGHFEALLRM